MLAGEIEDPPGLGDRAADRFVTKRRQTALESGSDEVEVIFPQSRGVSQIDGIDFPDHRLQ